MYALAGPLTVRVHVEDVAVVVFVVRQSAREPAVTLPARHGGGKQVSEAMIHGVQKFVGMLVSREPVRCAVLPHARRSRYRRGETRVSNTLRDGCEGVALLRAHDVIDEECKPARTDIYVLALRKWKTTQLTRGRQGELKRRREGASERMDVRRRRSLPEGTTAHRRQEDSRLDEFCHRRLRGRGEECHVDGLRRNSHNSKSYYKSCILSANILCAPAEAAFGG